jgi:hypothetical protein
MPDRVKKSARPAVPSRSADAISLRLFRIIDFFTGLFDLRLALRLQETSPVDHSQQDDHDSDHQQDMDEAAHGVSSDQPEQPQDEHNNGNGIKHDIDLSV